MDGWMEACAVAVGARRGREGNLVRTLIRTNGWRKVARSAETRQKTVDEGEKEEKKSVGRGITGWTAGMRDSLERPEKSQSQAAIGL